MAGVAMTGWGFSQEKKAETPAEEPAPAPPPVRVGIASEDQLGALPPLTTEVGKHAAKAFLKGDWLEARDAYLEILLADPDNALTLSNLGATYLQMKQLDKACASLEKALGLRPDLHATRVTLGLAYLESEKTYLAIATLSKAVADHPKDARAHNYLAVAARQRGWTDAAERELQAAVAADPEFAEAHYNLALVYMERKPVAHELARRHYFRAMDLGATPDSTLLARIEAAGK